MPGVHVAHERVRNGGGLMCAFVTLTNELADPPRSCTAKLLTGSAAPVELLLSPEMVRVLRLPKIGEGCVGGAKTDIHGAVKMEMAMYDPKDLHRQVGKEVRHLVVQSKELPHLYGNMMTSDASDLMKDKVDGTLGCPGLVKLGLSLDMGRSLFQASSL